MKGVPAAGSEARPAEPRQTLEMGLSGGAGTVGPEAGAATHRSRVDHAQRLSRAAGEAAGRLGRSIGRAPLWVVAVVAFAAVLGLLILPSLFVAPEPAPIARPGDVGIVDMSFAANGVKSPTGRKPETAKLWFNDGSWWGSIFSRARDAYVIERFDWAAGQWIDTGTIIDDRNIARADVLWDGSHLYAVSGGTDPTSSKHAALFLRFSYDRGSHSYSLDAGFPVRLTDAGAETFVLDRDGLGQVWVTFTHDRRVYVTHTLGDDRSWDAPYPLPLAEATNLTPDDISAVVAYDDHVGVMWSDQTDGAMYFAAHRNGAGDDAWSLSTAIQGPALADDHLNLKSLSHDPAGEVFAAIKTSRNDLPDADPSDPLIMLLVLRADGSWEHHVYGTVGDNQTRPLLLIDQEHRELYMFASAPCCSGGSIYYKTSPLDAISFASGEGIPFMRNGRSSAINNPASTRQNLDSSTDLLVIASDDKDNVYVHNTITLTGPPVPAPPASEAEPLPVPEPGAGAGSVDAADASRLLLEDGFESGDFAAWTSIAATAGGVAAVEAGAARSDRFAAHLAIPPGATKATASARFALPRPQSTISFDADVKVLAAGPPDGNVPLVRVFDAKGKRLLTVYRQNEARGRLWVSNDSARAPVDGKLPLETWAHLDVAVTVRPTGLDVRVRLDGTLVYQAELSGGTGSPVKLVQIGNDQRGRPFDLLVDNVRVFR